jgi:hypothetical protein
MSAPGGDFSNGGNAYNFVSGGTSGLILNRPGRLCRVYVLAAGSASTTFYDNTAASGTTLFVVPSTAAQGDIFDIQIPAQKAISVGSPGGAADLNVSWA